MPRLGIYSLVILVYPYFSVSLVAPDPDENVREEGGVGRGGGTPTPPRDPVPTVLKGDPSQREGVDPRPVGSNVCQVLDPRTECVPSDL